MPIIGVLNFKALSRDLEFTSPDQHHGQLTSSEARHASYKHLGLGCRRMAPNFVAMNALFAMRQSDMAAVKSSWHSQELLGASEDWAQTAS